MLIEKGSAYLVTAPTGYSTEVWVQDPNTQDTLLTTIVAGGTYQIGPYINDVNLRFVTQHGSPTITQYGSGVTPVTLRSLLGVEAATAVANATDADDIVAQFNALLAAMRVSGALVDDIPATIEFTAVTDAELETLTASEIVAVSGISAAVAISIDGDDAYEYRILGDAAGTLLKQDWTAEEGTVSNGQYVQVRLTSSDTNETEIVATLTVGTATAEFSVTTAAT